MNSPALYFKQLELGPMAKYVYLIGDPATKQALVVDPAWDVQVILDQLAHDGYEMKGMLVTHGHPDHINGVEELLNRTNTPVYMHKDEVPWIKGWKETAIATQNGDKIKIGNIEIECIHTPGHTMGSQCFRCHNQMLTGDTLFIDGCGRTDLPGGNTEMLYDTFNNVIKKLPDSTVIYPGHNYSPGKSDTLGHQKETNPYLLATREEFIRNR
ncbi:MAG: MBL fold metallo-hydrolase [Proteobacteria bacterium]|nr:MBL fold metallo-hydrolase [Pseudomonadota bacterium]